ncbi:MAG: PilZ domain-containing protein [Bdellovibrionales bacterium]|nr:PilZ domain-containing protein [Bdellovibrionales bacterium]
MFSLFVRRPWAIHNPLKSWTLAGLSMRECQLLVASMTDAEVKVSWAHHENWTEWKPLSEPECHDLFGYKDSAHGELPAVPQITQEDDHEITQVRMVTVGVQKRELIARKFTRYEAKVPVEIVVGSNTFSTSTLDMSEGGFCFEDKLPDWVAGYFTVVLNTPEKMFEFTCFLAEDQKKDKFRAEVAPTTSEQVINEFRAWLETKKFPAVAQR